jgi:hypothetical protein
VIKPVKPKSGSRDRFELRIFFALQVVTGIEDFTILVRCGAVKSRAIEIAEQEPFRYLTSRQGLKPILYYQRIVARLKSGPCYKALTSSGSLKTYQGV